MKMRGRKREKGNVGIMVGIIRCPERPSGFAPIALRRREEGKGVKDREI